MCRRVDQAGLERAVPVPPDPPIFDRKRERLIVNRAQSVGGDKLLPGLAPLRLVVVKASLEFGDAAAGAVAPVGHGVSRLEHDDLVFA